jgi:hypothetical protein
MAIQPQPSWKIEGLPDGDFEIQRIITKSEDDWYATQQVLVKVETMRTDIRGILKVLAPGHTCQRRGEWSNQQSLHVQILLVLCILWVALQLVSSVLNLVSRFEDRT